MKKSKRNKSTFTYVINILVVILCILAALFDAAYIYYKFFYTDYTTITNYIGDQVSPDIKNAEDLSEDENKAYDDRCFIEVRLMSNHLKNGVRLNELKFNFFSDYSLSQKSYISAGMQMVGDLEDIDETYINMDDVEEVVVDNYYYYDSIDGITYQGGYGNNSIGTIFNRKLKMTIAIDNEPYQIQLTGTQEEFGNSILGKFSLGKSYYHYGTLFNTLIRAVESNSFGYGDYYLSKVNLSKFFSVYKYENGKVSTDNVASWIDTYAVVKVHYDENGAESVRNSMFGIINADPSWGVTMTDTGDYWQERLIYNMNEFDMTYRESSELNGKLLYISQSKMNELQKYNRIKIIITINLDKLTDVVGLDYQAFKNLEIDTLIIKSSTSKEFLLLDESLHNTNLSKLCRSSTVNLIITNAFNNDYTEVVL